MAGKARFRSWRGVLPLLLLLLLAGGCSRIPRIIVLEDPLTASEHVELGVAYERKGELDLARREYERALLKDNKFFRARLNLGNIFLAKKEYGKARDEYLLALGLRPGDAEATNNLSWAAIFSGEGIDEALARMEAVVSGPVPPVFPTEGVPQQREARLGGTPGDPPGYAGRSPDERKPPRGGGGGLRPGRNALPAGRRRAAGGIERRGAVPGRGAPRDRGSPRGIAEAIPCPAARVNTIGRPECEHRSRTIHALQDRIDRTLAEGIGSNYPLTGEAPVRIITVRLLGRER